MKLLPALAALVCLLALSSCASIRFGRSTTVTIETDRPGDVVNIVAVGPKKTIDMQQVTLPYAYKVRHNNLPQRLEIISDSCTYEPFTIGAEHKGRSMGKWCRGLGYGELALTWGGLTTIGMIGACPPVIGAGIVLGILGGVPLLTVGYTAETDIPDALVYPATAMASGQPSSTGEADTFALSVSDVYTLINRGEYQLAAAKASYLLRNKPEAELYYLRGIARYRLADRKKALKDLNAALQQLDTAPDPTLRANVEATLAAINRRAQLPPIRP